LMSAVLKLSSNFLQSKTNCFTAGIGCERAPITYQIHDHPS